MVIIHFISYSQKDIKINYYQENDKVNLYAFVGEKISVIEFDPNLLEEKKIEISATTGDTIFRTSRVKDRAYKLKYKVIKNLYNNLKIDTVEFVAFDHYGKPNFTNYKSVILYISKSQNEKYYYHQKYQYNEIYSTRNNEWICLLNFGSYEKIEEGLKLKLKKIKLDESVSIDLANMPKQNIQLFYPKPFFEYKKNKALPVLGISIENLIRYKVESIIEEDIQLIKN